eukprot:489226_1
MGQWHRSAHAHWQIILKFEHMLSFDKERDLFTQSILVGMQRQCKVAICSDIECVICNFCGEYTETLYISTTSMQQLTDDPSLFPKLKHICHENKSDVQLWKNQLFLQILKKWTRKAIVKQMESIIKPICSEMELRRLYDELKDIADMDSFDPLQLLSDTLKRLKQGFVCRRAKFNEFKSIKLYVENDTLYYKPKTNKSWKAIGLKHIRKIRAGKAGGASVLKQKKYKRIAVHRCYSIDANINLSLVFQTRALRDECFEYIYFIHRHYKKQRKVMYDNGSSWISPEELGEMLDCID